MPNPTFQAIVSAVNTSGAAFRAARSDLAGVRKEADATRGALVKLERPGLLSRISGGTHLLGERFGELNHKVAETRGLLGELFPVLAGLGAVGSVAGLFELVEKVAHSRAEFIATADKIGVTTTQLMGLNYAARMADVPIEAMQLGMTRLNKTMGEAGLGKAKPAAAILRRLGFSIADIKKGTITAADVLPKLADSFAHTENAALKTWVATTLFGRGGMALIPLLNRGGNAIREYAREAEQLGYVFSKEDNENLEAYHHSMIRLDTAVQGFIGLVGSELAPVLRPIVDDMALWIRANRDWIATGITGSVKDLSDFLKQQDWAGAGRDLGSLASGAGQVVTQLGGLKTVVEGLVLLKVAGWVWGLARGFVAMAAGLDAIAGSAIFAPAAVAALAAVAAAIGTMATANVLGRIRYGDTLEHLRDEHEHPLKYPGYRNPDGPAFGPYSAADPLHPFKGIETPAMREFRLQGERTRESAAAHDEAQRRIAEEEAERERQRHPPPFDPGPVYPPGFPGGFIQFPSPFPDRTAGGLGLGRGGVDGQLRILLEIPNLPEGARVTTETSGNVPEPQVDVGRANPLDGF